MFASNGSSSQMHFTVDLHLTLEPGLPVEESHRIEHALTEKLILNIGVAGNPQLENGVVKGVREKRLRDSEESGAQALNSRRCRIRFDRKEGSGFTAACSMGLEKPM